MSERIARLRERLDTPFLVSNGTNLAYLTGFHSSNAALLVEPDRLRLFTDFRYLEGARRVEGVEIVETKRNLYRSLAEALDGSLAFEATDLTYDRWETLRDGGIELIPTRGVVEELRARKDEGELAAIRRASEITTRGLERLAEETFVGRTERDLAWTLERFLREEGAEGLAFEIAIGSGPNGASPHGDPGDRVVEAGELVVVDVGARADGYCSDCTRTFATGELPDEAARTYEVCLDAQLRSLAATRAGAVGRDVDAVARDVIVAAGYGDQFGHGLGHGVGLMVHEAPTLRPESEDVLAPGNVVSVEPGIYLPGRFGVRIEDLVVVTEGEPEVLTGFPKELRTV
ncbi:MAG: Xaa-Pro aminopeptidase [Gaiellaceae bacterium]|nr:Xaa-Pro aminopeptidase [Gaiellaceae bacterium]